MRQFNILALGSVAIILILISCSKMTGGGGGDDGNSPFVIFDLRVAAVTDSTIQLKWTATGDDSSSGTADHYDIRYSRQIIESTDWNNATQVVGEPRPSPAGQTDSMTVMGLMQDSTYYFAIMAYDEAGNSSGLSPCARGICFTDIVVVFPDSNFEAAIRNLIHKPTGDIHRSDLMQTEHRLDATNRSIANMSGIQYCVSLDELWMGLNQVSDLGPISHLTNLREIQFYNNNLSDISAISGLNNLGQIWLSANNIADISSLSGLKNLHSLNLSANLITDIHPLVLNDSLGTGDIVHLEGNPPFSQAAIADSVTLVTRGVVLFH